MAGTWMTQNVHGGRMDDVIAFERAGHAVLCILVKTVPGS